MVSGRRATAVTGQVNLSYNHWGAPLELVVHVLNDNKFILSVSRQTGRSEDKRSEFNEKNILCNFEFYRELPKKLSND